MNRIIAILVVFVGSLSVFAQPPAGMAERMEQLKSKLNLTPEQVERLKPILQKEGQELKAIRDSNASDTSRRGKLKMAREMKGVQDKYSGSIAAILTPEQNKTWKAMKDEFRAKMREQKGR